MFLFDKILEFAVLTKVYSGFASSATALVLDFLRLT